MRILQPDYLSVWDSANVMDRERVWRRVRARTQPATEAVALGGVWDIVWATVCHSVQRHIRNDVRDVFRSSSQLRIWDNVWDGVRDIFRSN